MPATGESHRSHVFRLSDGRRLGYLHLGDVAGETCFYFHGTPGSRFEATLVDRAAKENNLSLIAPDRPGYGLSDPCPGRRIGDWPADVIQLADALGFARFGVIGVSGGGPYALACAHAMATRLTAVSVVCGLGPVYLDTLAREMPGFERLAFDLQRRYPRAFTTLYGGALQLLATHTPRTAVRLLAWRCGPPDQAILLRGDVHAGIARSLPQAFAQGPQGASRDLHLYQRPWGFELADIGHPVQLWHGNADRIVPPGHSLYMHEQLPDSTLTRIAGAGHFSLPVLEAGRILSALRAAC